MKFILALLFSVFAVQAFAAGTVTTSKVVTQIENGKRVDIVQINWTSDGSGNADAAIILNGYVVKAVTDPVDGPTDNYDITFVQNGVDAAGALLADRDTTNSEQVYTYASGAPTPAFLVGSHTFTIAAAGATKSGIVYLYLIQSL